MTPYYQDETTTLYHGDHREILPQLGQRFDLIVADPPYGETSLSWDRWPQGWVGGMADYADSMWVFGSMRMFLERGSEFLAWKLSQDVVWEKHNGSNLAADRFSRVHEHYESKDGGPRLMRSVIFARSMNGKAINETEKPVAVLEPLISYACPPGGIVLDPFGGSGSTAAAARSIGRKTVLIERREEQCEGAALRLSHQILDFTS